MKAAAILRETNGPIAVLADRGSPQPYAAFDRGRVRWLTASEYVAEKPSPALVITEGDAEHLARVLGGDPTTARGALRRLINGAKP